MTRLESATRAPLQVARDVLIRALPSELTPAVLLRVRQDVLRSIINERLRGVVLDAGAVEVMDSTDYRSLRETARMCEVMGRHAVICGLAPGVVSSLVDLDIDTTGLVTTGNVDAALTWLSTRGP